MTDLFITKRRVENRGRTGTGLPNEKQIEYA